MPLLHTHLSRSIRSILFAPKAIRITSAGLAMLSTSVLSSMAHAESNLEPIIPVTVIENTNNTDYLATTKIAQSPESTKKELYEEALYSNSAQIKPMSPTAESDRNLTSVEEITSENNVFINTDNSDISKIEAINNKTKLNQSNLPIKKNNSQLRQSSLDRLTDYYQPLEKINQNLVDSNNNVDTKAGSKNRLTNIKNTYKKVTQAPRCEGVWVYPDELASNNSSNEQQNSGADKRKSQDKTDIPAGALHALADYGYYDNENYAELSGNVVINQNGQLIKADKVTLDLATNTANAEGQVLFANNLGSNVTKDSKNNQTSLTNIGQTGIIGIADQLKFDTQNKQSSAQGVAFASVELQAHGYAAELNKPNKHEVKLTDVMFTTCSPNNRKWHLDAKNIDLDTESGRGIARNVTLNIADIPVIYLPYFNFPIDDRRTTGFLTPSASYNAEQGLEVELPYYINFAPDYDATVSTRIFTNNNPMLTTEFRYLTDGYGQGRIFGTYLPKDRKYNNENRSSFFYGHKWQSESLKNLTANVDYNYVSDPEYTNDFNNLGVTDNQANLPRRAQVNYFNEYLDAELKVETYQNLEANDIFGNRVTDAKRPYKKLPQLTVDYQIPWFNRSSDESVLNKLVVTGTHDSGYFKQSINDGSASEKSGFRIYNKISASYPLSKPWGYIKPKLNLQHIYSDYDKSSVIANGLDNQNANQSTFVPQISLDMGLNLQKNGAPTKWAEKKLGGSQFISPRLKYSYAPFKQQNDMPNFNTSVASINYEQLYNDSWFIGHDRLQDLHALTPGVNYRYIDATGLTRLDASMAQQFYLDAGEVTLDDISNSDVDTHLFNEKSSGLVTSFSAQPVDNLWIDVNSALTHNYDLNFVTSQIRYQPTDASMLSFGIIERKENKNTNQMPLSAITASAIFPINNKWRILAQGQYDYKNNKAIDSLVGLDYEDCCMGFSVYTRRYYNDLNLTQEPTNSIMAELRLNGLSDGSSRLIRLLSDKIHGFNSTQQAWKR